MRRSQAHKANHTLSTRSRPVHAALVAIAISLCLMLIPFVGMLWHRTDATTENRTLADFPAFFDEEGFNSRFLQELGGYFDDHFAYRNEMTTAQAIILSNLLLTSPNESVISGTDGWLYYTGTLDYYMGTNRLTERDIDNIVFNLKMMQSYCESSGAQFFVVIVPNKNTLYPDHMPYYYMRSSEVHDAELVNDALTASGVNIIDLFDALRSAEGELYFHRDSHWNTRGAYVGYLAIIDSLGIEANRFNARNPMSVADHVGDLDSMMYPVFNSEEEDVSFGTMLSWSYLEGAAVSDAIVRTSGSGERKLLMFRDSFANSLIPFLATAYDTALFSKMIPFDLEKTRTFQPDDVIIEQSEWHMSEFATNPAIMPAPRIDLEGIDEAPASKSGGITVQKDGSYSIIEGVIPQMYAQKDVSFYIELIADEQFSYYVPYHVSIDSNGYGFKAFIPSDIVDYADGISVVVTTNGKLVRVLSV